MNVYLPTGHKMHKYRIRTMVAYPLLVLLSTFVSCAGTDFSQEEVERFHEAQILFRNQKFDDAEKILAALREKKPANAEAGVLHAKIKFYTRDFKSAEEILREVQKGNEESPYVAMWLGRVVMLDPARQDEASAIFREILKRDPENFTAHYYLGRTLENQENVRLALSSYQAALAQEYQISKIHLHMVKLFTDLSMPDRAKKHRERIKALGASHNDIEDAGLEPGSNRESRKK